MKKKLILLLLILIICSGCTRIDNINDYNIIIDNILNNSFNKQNTTSLGYTYYLPLGVSKVYDKDYNQKFKLDDTYIYLYVDTVSYYYQNSLNLNENITNNYYYRNLDNDNKKGYIKIEKDDDNYIVKIVYNYAKIESYVPEKQIKKVLAYSMIILDSINYNDNLIKIILENENEIGVEKEFKIDKPSDTKSKFSEYLSEYVQEEENNIPDLPEY